VYDADPYKNPNAKRFDRLDFLQAINLRLDVMDSTALSLCMDNNLSIIVFDLFVPEALRRALMGESTGTLIAGRV
jgi:uridylate kinase